MTAPDIVLAATPVVRLFEEMGVRYRIGGSVASSALGAARATLDVDLVADLRPQHVSRLVSSLRDAYHVDLALVRDAVARRSSFNAIHLETMLKVDVFVLGRRAYDVASFEREIRDTLEEGEGAREFSLTTAEDTILRKLEWYRLGNEVSDRQWSDVIGVIRVQADALDRAYLVRWAKELGVEDLLTRAENEARS